jgi:hypothetical protein
MTRCVWSTILCSIIYIQAKLLVVILIDQVWKGSVGEGEVGKKAKTTPDTGGKSDRTDYIQKERDDNRGDDADWVIFFLKNIEKILFNYTQSA